MQSSILRALSLDHLSGMRSPIPREFHLIISGGGVLWILCHWARQDYQKDEG